jgi:hypothetical protein
MKPAEDWAKQIGAAIDRQDGYPLMQSEYSFIIKQIQIDAIKEGMLRAAKLCDGHPDWVPADNDECKSTILSTVNRLTEKDL